MYEYTSMFKYYTFDKSKDARDRKRFLGTMQKVIEERIPEDMEVTVNAIRIDDNQRIAITLDGKNADDLIFCSNILKEITGASAPSNKISRGQVLKGTFSDVGKVGFGVFVDVGIIKPTKDVLVPLFHLREQLVMGKKIPLTEIIEKYGFMDHLPVTVEITKIEYIKGGEPKFEAQLAEEYLEEVKERVGQGLEIIMTTGLSRQGVKKTIAKRGHSIDITEIQRLGPMETAVYCKEGTYASGIISRIGKFIPACMFSTFRPSLVSRYWK